MPQAAYLHIPFCRRRCFYCDFPIAVAGDRARGETSPRIQGYVDILCQEIKATPILGPHPLQTVFFGGGTPSLLSIDQVAQILGTLEQQFGIATTAEISMEMDPGTFNRAQLRSLRRLGLTRVSLGVQSFHDVQLEVCGRTHRRQDINQAVNDIQAVGVPAWSIDLISGLPEQTLANWQENLATAIALCSPHLSIYDLTVEPNTVFDRRYTAGQSPLPSDSSTAEMYRTAQQTLTQNGYEHYEVSNYAQPGYQCQHNRTYWKNRPYYGFGMGAASYTQHQRYHRPRTLAAYQQWVVDYQQRGGSLECDPTLPAEQWLDQLMMGLRLAEGLNLVDLAMQFGADRVAQLKDCLEAYIHKGWVQIDSLPEPHLRLHDPEGFLFSNQVLVRLFETFSDPEG